MVVLVLFSVVVVVKVHVVVSCIGLVDAFVRVCNGRMDVLVLVHQVPVPVRVGVTHLGMSVLVNVTLLVAVRHSQIPPPWKFCAVRRRLFLKTGYKNFLCQARPDLNTEFHLGAKP